MSTILRRIFCLLSVSCLSAPVFAESHVSDGGGFGVKYASEECNNETDYLTDNGIVCTAVFSDTKVWDFLNSLPRRIDVDTLTELNPELGDVTFDTIITGITFVRVR